MKITSLFCYYLCLSFLCKAQIITTIAGGATGHGGYWGDGGPATAAELGYFGSVAVDSEGNVYIGDTNNQRIRKVDASTGIITTIAGTGTAGYNGDGIQATNAQLNYPGPIAFDKNGNLYFVDGNNFRIRQINKNTGIISTYAGNGILGSDGDGGIATSAKISTGYLAFDKHDNLYISCTRKIRKITSAGVITTIAGTGFPGVTSDGVLATTTNLGGPRGVATDSYGNVYFGDSTSAIRKVSVSTGIITRFAGTGDNVWSPYSGDGLAATSCHISTFGIAVDDTNNLYNSDYGNSRIQKIDLSGTITTIAGTGIAGFSGDGDIATAARINFPQYVALDKCNNVYIADFMNKRVRKITYHTDCDATTKSKEIKLVAEISIYPNPASKSIHISPASGMTINSIGIINYMGCLVYQQDNVGKQNTSIGIDHLPKGVYVVQVNGVYMQRFVKE